MTVAYKKVEIIREGKGSAAALKDINDVNVLTERVRLRKEVYFSTIPHLSSERSRLVTESWKETNGIPLILRRARLFQKVMENLTVSIWENELIVGSQTEYLRGASPAIDYSTATILGALSGEKVTIKGEVAEAGITEEERESLLEDAKYWKDQAPGDVVRKLTLEKMPELVDYIDAHMLGDAPFTSPCGGLLPDYDKIMTYGINGVRQQINEALAQLDFSIWESWRKYEFLQAGIICCDAVVNFASRYSKLAKQLAQKENNTRRKRELEQIAEHCNWVPANPARTFHEALQCLWFIHLCSNLESSGAGGEAPGRMDQYLFPLYERDILEGKITRQEAAELLGCLWVKLNETELVLSLIEKQTGQASQFQDTTIGGVTKDGKDATNDLTFLILEVARQMKMTQPPLYLRCHQNMCEDILFKAVETNRDHGAGMPAFINDAPAILKLTDRGVPLKDARNWIAAGCVLIYIPGASHQKAGFICNKVKVFELTFYNGVEPRSGKQLGPKTGDPVNFKSYDEFYQAFLKQVEHFNEIAVKASLILPQIVGEVSRFPFASILLDDCIAKGRDFLEEGLRYPWLRGDLADVGYQNIADSLSAIKKLVYEEKKITMGELIEALKVNFEGKEKLRQMLLSAPKYGNDDDYADDIFNIVSSDLSKMTVSYRDFYGKPLYLARGGSSIHYWAGNTLGALPDGRKAWESTADAQLSPVQGVDIKGPTAVFLSATKANHMEYAMTTLLNMKILPSLLRTKEGIRKLISLMKAYFDRGGWYVQFNMIEPELLLEAKKHPENYRDLMVRVAGYSAYFVELSPKIQEEIIFRTLHSF